MKIIENSKLLRVWYPFAFAFGGIKNLAGVTYNSNIYLWKSISDYPERIIWHEVCHAIQQQIHGMPKYIYYHCKDWLQNKKNGMSNYDAYRNIRWEREAYRLESKELLIAKYPEFKEQIDGIENYLILQE